jgi:hypothetical protein
MRQDIDETELFEYGGYVCAVRTMQSKHTNAEPWHQGVMYRRDGTRNQSNWYLKPEDAIKMAKVMVRQEKK